MAVHLHFFIYLFIMKPLDATIAADKDMRMWAMEEEDWKSLRDINAILEYFDIATTLISKEKYPTLHAALPVYNYVIEQLQDMRYQNITMDNAIQAALDKLNLYYSKAESAAYYIGTGKLHDSTFFDSSQV